MSSLMLMSLHLISMSLSNARVGLLLMPSFSGTWCRHLFFLGEALPLRKTGVTRHDDTAVEARLDARLKIRPGSKSSPHLALCPCASPQPPHTRTKPSCLSPFEERAVPLTCRPWRNCFPIIRRFLTNTFGLMAPSPVNCPVCTWGNNFRNRYHVQKSDENHQV